MEDKSIIKPILDALEYFNASKEEINYFYKIIDKFCANWFGKNININNLTSNEMTLIHDLLGEYIRFEENNKRVALWLLSINRVCYNYSVDLSSLKEELNLQSEISDQNFDSTLIEPILVQLRMLNVLHKDAGKNDLGQSDIISNFLQWVMVYSTIIYPSLENKFDFYDNTILKAMHFILLEFIKQRSNDKRMAYLIMAIIEACKNYSIQTDNDCSSFINTYNPEEGAVIPGQEETMIKELLEKLKDQTIQQRDNEEDKNNNSIESYIKNRYDNFIDTLLNDTEKVNKNFNSFIEDLTEKVISLEIEKTIAFFKILFRYRSHTKLCLNQQIIDILKNSIDKLPDNSKDWINKKIKNFSTEKEQYIKNIIKYRNKKRSEFFKYVKPYIMIFLIYKLELFS
ncbi:MAG: hypothetical protein JXB50_03895 [Spirochaetes bacterium]|nr:hypothetical protein [Spirochaetota bacterium]